MPLKSARVKNSRTVKENVYDTVSSKLNPKATRKPLSDKTNSASDDNISPPSPKYITETRKKVGPAPNSTKKGEDLKMQTRRKRKIPERFNDNQLLIKLNKTIEQKENEKNANTKKFKPAVTLTHLKTDDKLLETNLADCRPKRICRLPSRFDDHSSSPSKNVPVQPIQASTPITQCKGSKTILTKIIQQDKQMDHKEITTTLKNKADTNNNANVSVGKTLCKKSPCKNSNKKINKPTRLIDQDYSLKMFEDKKKATKRDASNLDIYEFTYDPTEEPPPQKKKCKRTVRKKQEKQQPVFTNNYNKNVTRSLIALKNVLSAKKLQSKTKPEKVVKQNKCTDVLKQNELNQKNKIQGKTERTEQQITYHEQNVTQKNYNSFRVEDIIVNDESVCSAGKEMNYSPVNSPYNVRLPSESRDHFDGIQKSDDPLNLQAISFFDDNPAASSSMNMSARDPTATPWRVEFGQLPIKWQANTYVKPNMTPAFESSFLVLGDKKKHVYTNIINEDNEQLPEMVETESAPKLRQTSIISFIKEVAEKSAKKKLKSTPIKNNTVFDDISNISHNLDITPEKQMTSKSPKKSITPRKNKSLENVASSNGNISVSDKENSVEKCKKKNKDITFFGFDDTEEIDQENILPKNHVDKSQKKAFRPRSRAILQQLNQKEPSIVPVSVTANVDKRVKRNINKILEDAKIKDTESSPEKINHSNYGITSDINNDVIINGNNMTQEDSQSVHLFEDLEVVHHVKPPRKSYVKQKRVAFRKNSVSSDSRDSDVAEQDESCTEEDNLYDLTFQIQSMQPKKTKTKKKSKKLLSKKEVKEVEAWAAGFNSMCEDVDEFDLVIE